MNRNLIAKLKEIEAILSKDLIDAPQELLDLKAAVKQVLLKSNRNPERSKQPEMTDSTIHIWSDGACSGNPGPGGWGTIVEIEEQRYEYSGGSRSTTNNIMELTGALEGIKNTPVGCSIVLTSDSQYLVKGMTQWLAGWKKRNWKKADGKHLLNQALWLELDKETQKRSIRWVWIKGHAGHPENERCDELARQAIKR